MNTTGGEFRFNISPSLHSFLTSSMTAVVQPVSSLMPWWAMSISSLAVWSFREKLLLVII